MTDKEMAKTWVNYHYDPAVKLNRYSLEGAYLAGLNEGRPKWHSLAKNPNDLPPIGKSCMRNSIMVVDEYDRVIYYDYDSARWRDYEGDYLSIQPALWCEIPKYTEE